MSQSAPAEPNRSPNLSRPRYLIGLLSALVPGLGHALAGRRGQAILFFAPVGVAILVAATLLATTSSTQLVAHLVNPSLLSDLLVLQAVLLVWRLAALGSGLLVTRELGFGPRDVVPVGALLAFVILPQAALGYVTNVARETADEIFQPSQSVTVWRPTPPPATPLPPGATPAPATLSPSPTPTTPRLNVLLIGMDSGFGRHTALTDTLIVASLDPLTKTVSMLSIPRDLVDVPLPGGGVFHPKINSLATYANGHPNEFPGSNGDGHAVLAGALSELLGIQIDYWAQVNLFGFVQLVDTVGGVDVTVTHALCDPDYDDYGLSLERGFAIPAGRFHLRGAQALAFARIRKSSGESDFTRAARQQQVLVALRDAVIRGGFLGDPIGFLRAVGQTVQTNVPPDLLPTVAGLADEIDRSRVYQAVIRYPLVHPSGVPDPRGSIQLPDLAGIRALSAAVFPPAGQLPTQGEPAPAEAASSGRGKAAPISACRAAPSTTPSPGPRASASPRSPAPGSVSPSGEPSSSDAAGSSAAPSSTNPSTQSPEPVAPPSDSAATAAP